MHARMAAGDAESIAAYISWSDIAGPMHLSDSVEDLRPIDVYRRESSVGTENSDSTARTDTSRKSSFMERLLNRTRRNGS